MIKERLGVVDEGAEGGGIHFYSHSLSSLCVTDKADSTLSIWEDRIIIQTAPCCY